MSTISSEEIISILKEEIENYEEISKGQETGRVITVGDGIARIYGLDHAMYGEIVTFENGAGYPSGQHRLHPLWKGHGNH